MAALALWGAGHGGPAEHAAAAPDGARPWSPYTKAMPLLLLFLPLIRLLTPPQPACYVERDLQCLLRVQARVAVRVVAGVEVVSFDGGAAPNALRHVVACGTTSAAQHVRSCTTGSGCSTQQAYASVCMC